MKREKIAFDMGYRVIDGVAFSPKGKRVAMSGSGYLNFGIRPPIKLVGRRVMIRVHVHRLVAFQKFGDELFASGIQVRHLDSNSRNNMDYNIAIGSAADNHYDKSPEKRRTLIESGAKSITLYDRDFVERVRDFRRLNLTYKAIGKLFGLTKRKAYHICKYNYVLQ